MSKGEFANPTVKVEVVVVFQMNSCRNVLCNIDTCKKPENEFGTFDIDIAVWKSCIKTGELLIKLLMI